MFNVNTTFVLGAGASKDYGYPIGDELIQQLIEYCKPYFDHKSQIHDKTEKAHVRLYEALKFYDPISIDAFLTHYKDDEYLIKAAKEAIISVILSCANKSYFERNESKKDGEGNWLRFVWGAMTQGANVEQLLSDDNFLKFNFITFNYDSSLEYFLHSRVKSEHSMFTPEQGDKFLDRLKERIHHVYGCVMDYDWMGGPDHYSYYGNMDKYAIQDHANRHFKRIHLIDERANSEYYKKLSNILRLSKQVIFLGFGFDLINIGQQVLNIEEALKGRSYDTSYGRTFFPVVKYTNFDNSNLIERRIESYITRYRSSDDLSPTGINKDQIKVGPNRDNGVFRTTKSVYDALSYDFNLVNY